MRAVARVFPYLHRISMFYKPAVYRSSFLVLYAPRPRSSLERFGLTLHRLFSSQTREQLSFLVRNEDHLFFPLSMSICFFGRLHGSLDSFGRFCGMRSACFFFFFHHLAFVVLVCVFPIMRPRSLHFCFLIRAFSSPCSARED